MLLDEIILHCGKLTRRMELEHCFDVFERELVVVRQLLEPSVPRQVSAGLCDDGGVERTHGGCVPLALDDVFVCDGDRVIVGADRQAGDVCASGRAGET